MARDALVHPEIFSREGALIRRSDVALPVAPIWVSWRSITFTSKSLAVGPEAAL